MLHFIVAIITPIIFQWQIFNFSVKMAKNQFNGPKQKSHIQIGLKKKDKFTQKLKSKLKSALSNERNTAAENLVTEAKTQKSQAKFSIPSGPSTSGFKVKVDPSAFKSNKVEKKSKVSNKPSGSVKENGTQNADQQQFSGKSKIKHVPSTSGQLKKKPLDNVLNGAKESEPLPKKIKQKKKKKKQKQAQNPAHDQSTVRVASKSSNDQESSKKSRRKFDNAEENKSSGKKRFKTVGGFVETNAHNEEETKLVNENLKKKKEKKKNKPKLESDPNTPKIKVHNVEQSNVNGSASNSDSEADSYIDKFFGDDENNFDENRIYALDEIEADQENGFLLMGSGEVDEASPESTTQVNKKNKKKQKKQKKPEKKSTENLQNSSPTNKLVSYEHSDDEAEYDFDEYMWPEEDGDDVYTESDYDSDDSKYGSDSEISLGSEVDSDDTYECESTDISMDEYEDDMSYDGYEEHTSDSEHSGYSESMSASSGDTYDDFLNSRRYDDDHSSNDDHEYTSEFLFMFLFSKIIIFIQLPLKFGICSSKTEFIDSKLIFSEKLQSI